MKATYISGRSVVNERRAVISIGPDGRSAQVGERAIELLHIDHHGKEDRALVILDPRSAAELALRLLYASGGDWIKLLDERESYFRAMQLLVGCGLGKVE